MTFIPGWNQRPQIVPPPSKIDKIFEAVALIGILLAIIIIIIGAVILPNIIPTHYKITGGVDTYGSKWGIFLVFLIPMLFIYGLITFVNKYPSKFNYATMVTPENALRLYSSACTSLRLMKVLMVWLFLILEWFTVIVLSNNPGLTGLSWLSWIIMLVFFAVIAVSIIYAVKNQIREGKPKNVK